MKTAVAMGEACRFALQHALMIYAPEGSAGYGARVGHAYVTLHDVEHQKDGPPQLGPARPADLKFLRELTKGLQASVPPEILPDYVLCRTPDTIAWWSPRVRRPMFFLEDSDLGTISGKVLPQPALVWKIVGQSIYVQALGGDERPDEDTPLYTAPYWNTNPDGRVCLGSMKRPGSVAVNTLRQWEEGYFGSLFTGQNGGGDLVEGGLVKLWTELAEKPRSAFPVDRLILARQTLGEWVKGGSRV